MPRLIGRDACGDRDLVELDAELTPATHRIAVEPPAPLNCRMAESLAGWLRDAVVSRVAELGSPRWSPSKATILTNAVPATGCQAFRACPWRRHRSACLGTGRRFVLTNRQVDAGLLRALRDSACQRFTTVLGPGKAGHNGHLNLDETVRHGGYRVCEWDLFTAPPVLLSRARPVMPDAQAVVHKADEAH